MPTSYSSSSATITCSYGIVLDAGSSGTRIHVYDQEEEEHRKGFGIPRELFRKKIKPGISSYGVNRLDVLERVTVDLVKQAKRVVPDTCRSRTPIHLMATAGMRLLRRVSDRDDILEACRRALRRSGFLFRNEWARVIDGHDEAIFDWLSINLALRRLPLRTDKGEGIRSPFVGVADLGGASAQIAFEVSAEFRAHPGVRRLRFGDRDVNVYAVSRLNYGLYEAYDRVQNDFYALASNRGKSFPCDYRGVELEEARVRQGADDFDDINEQDSQFTVESGNFDKCASLVRAFLIKGERTNLGGLNRGEKARPPFPERSREFELYGIDNFGKMVSILEAVAMLGDADHQVTDAEKLREFTDFRNVDWDGIRIRGASLCGMDWDYVRENVPKLWHGAADEKKLRAACFGAAYVTSLLRDLYVAIDDSTVMSRDKTQRIFPRIVLANELNGKDASWPLGAMYAVFSEARGEFTYA
eukprot:g2400.t1